MPLFARKSKTGFFSFSHRYLVYLLNYSHKSERASAMRFTIPRAGRPPPSRRTQTLTQEQHDHAGDGDVESVCLRVQLYGQGGASMSCACRRLQLRDQSEGERHCPRESIF